MRSIMAKEKETLDIVVAGYIMRGDRLLLIHHKKLDKWLPVGGHIEKNEIPDIALRREIREEVGMEVEFLEYPASRRGNSGEIAMPFYVNKHHISNKHSHYCLFYLLKHVSGELNIQKNELKGGQWLARHELKSLSPALNSGDIATCFEAFDLAKKYIRS